MKKIISTALCMVLLLLLLVSCGDKEIAVTSKLAEEDKSKIIMLLEDAVKDSAVQKEPENIPIPVILAQTDNLSYVSVSDNSVGFLKASGLMFEPVDIGEYQVIVCRYINNNRDENDILLRQELLDSAISRANAKPEKTVREDGKYILEYAPMSSEDEGEQLYLRIFTEMEDGSFTDIAIIINGASEPSNELLEKVKNDFVFKPLSEL